MAGFYAKGTIKIKNADGILEPFLPVTDFSCVSNSQNKSLRQTLDELDTKVTEAENAGGIEIMHFEPMDSNTQECPDETLIVWYNNPVNEGTKHLSVAVSKDSQRLLKVGDVVTFTYAIINDSGD